MDELNRQSVGGVYHVMNKSIAGYRIFNGEADYERASMLLSYYAYDGDLEKFSRLKQIVDTYGGKLIDRILELDSSHERRVDIWAYCLMPTHVHLLLRQRTVDGVSSYISDVLNSYSRYFNTAHERKGPLWVGRYKSVRVNSDEQLLHVSRYINLNPVTARLVENPADWKYSSFNAYSTYAGGSGQESALPCNLDELPFPLDDYQAFVEDGVDYQRSMSDLKHLVLE